VGDFEPGGALVVEVGEGAFFEAGVFGGGGHDGGVAEEGAGFGGDVGEVVSLVDAGSDGVEPFGALCFTASKAIG
jgi:hypothetical protein